jgi:hypothetical protein
MAPRRIARASVARWRRIWVDGNVGTAIAGASRPAVGSENDHAGRDDEYRAGNSELSRRCSRGGCEGLSPRDWSGDDWRELFRFTGVATPIARFISSCAAT